MNGSTGIQPTVELATTNGTGFMPYNSNGFFGGDGIWAIVLLALLFNGGWGGFGNNNVATTEYISSEVTQRDINNGFQNQSNLIANGFSNAAQDTCNLKTEVMENRYSNLLSASNTQRDILMQTTQLENQANVNALQMQSKLDECCCNLRAQGIENTQKILDVMNQNTIDSLRSEVNDLKNTITATGIGTSIVNQIRPFPIPSYQVSSPYVGIYGNGFYGNTII